MKRSVYSNAFIFLYSIILCTACGSASEMNDEYIEIATPLSCTIPGELQLESETKSILSQYQK
ncbi:MAG: hypothetical protein KAG34_03460 [Cocleimonas sp.]|nr:hypothetical protein [Cocleimonas sp.]